MTISWSARIKKLESLGWSQAALAAAIGRTPQAVCDLKHGRTIAPKGNAAVKLHHLHATLEKPRQ